MTGGGAERYPGYGDRTKASMDDTTDLYSLLRTMPFSPTRIQAPIFGSGSASAPGGGFLKTEGDTMMGPIAFSPRLATIDANGRIDISEATASGYSTYVLVTGAGSPDDLRIIEGAGFNGQWIVFQGTAAQTINIKHAKLRFISNIVGTTTVTVTTTTNHGYTTGNLINVLGTVNFDIQDASITVTGVTTFTYAAAGSVSAETTGTTQDGNVVTADGTDVQLAGGSDNDVPIANFIFDVTVAGFGAWRYMGGSGTGGGGGGNQTPWLSDIDADGWDLNDLSNILFRDSAGLPIGTDTAIWRENAGDLHLNVPTAKQFIFEVNDTIEYEFDAGAADWNSNNVGGMGTILFKDTVQTIGSISNGLEVRQSDTFDFSFWFNGAETYTLAQGAMNFHDQNIAAVDTILMSNGGATIFSISSGIETRVSGGFDHSLWVGGVEEYTFNATEFIVNNNKIEFTLATQFIQGSAGGLAIQVPVGVGSTIDFSTSGGGSTFNIGQSVTVSNQDFDVNANAIFLDADADTKIQAGTDDVIQITNGGTLTISLSETSLVTTIPITMGGIIDMNGNNIDGIDYLEFTGTTEFINHVNTVGFNFELPIGERFAFQHATVSSFEISDGTTSVLNAFVASGATSSITSANIFLGDADADIIHITGITEIEDRTVPADPVDATSVNMFLNSVTGELSVRKFGSTTVSLEAGGGAQTPWTSNIDADNFSLQDLGVIEFRATGKTLPAATVTYIGNDGTDLVLNVRDNGTSESIDFMTVGALRATVNSSLVSTISLDVTGDAEVHGTVPLVTLFDTSTGAADAEYAAIPLEGEDSAGSGPFEFGRISGIQRNVTNGVETGEIIFWVAEGGTGASTAGTSMSFGFTESDATPMLKLQSNAQIIDFQLFRDNANTGSIADIDYFAEDSAGNKTFYASITADIHSGTDPDEEGELGLWVKRDGSASLENMVELNGGTGLHLGGGSTSNAWDFIGFFGTTPIQIPTLASDTLGNLLTALRALGLIV